MDQSRRSEAEQHAYFEAVYERACAAEAAAGPVATTLRIAQTTVRLVFAGSCLVPYLLPALAHLETMALPQPDVTLHIWDSTSTGIAMLPPPCAQDCFTDRGDIWGFLSQRFKFAFHWSEFSVNLMDLQRGIGIYWIRNATTLPYWVTSSPLRSLLHWWMEQQGYQLLHAAAVATATGALLITGKGGVGKSTTALACLAHGLFYLADDYVLVGLEPAPTVYSLYSTAKLTAEQMAKFPQFTRLLSNHPKADVEKAVMFLHPHYTDQITLSAPLCALATPRITAQAATRFSPTSLQTLRHAAAFTTLAQLPYAGQRTQSFIERLVNSLPGLELTLGSNLAHVAQTIQTFLQEPTTMGAACAPPATLHRVTEWPLVTVIIPVYNGAHFLPAAIDNVLSQQYPALEIIVVNDGSTDPLDEVVQSLPVDVRYFTQPNFGPSMARNRGIKDASGAFLAFLDVDDLWPDNNLSVLVDILVNHPQIEVVHGRGQLVAFDTATGHQAYIGNPQESFPFYIGAGLYRRSAFTNNGLFDAELRFAEDMDWFTRAREQGLNIKHLDQVTLFVRRHTQNMTRGKSLIELNTLRVFKKALDRQRRRETKGGEGALETLQY